MTAITVPPPPMQRRFPSPIRGRITAASWLIGCFLVAGPACAAFQPVDDFDDRPWGDIRLQEDWSGSAGTGTVERDPTGTVNRVLAIRTNSGVLRRPLEVPDGGSATLFFRLRFGEQQNWSIGLSPLTSPTEFGDFAPELGMASARNVLRVWEGVADHYEDLAPLAPETWLNVWVHVDTAADRFQIWVHDRPCDAAVPGDQLDVEGNPLFGFRSGNGAVDLRTFYVKTGGGQGGPGTADGPVFVDDIQLDLDGGAANLTHPLAGRVDYRESFAPGSSGGWTADTGTVEPEGGFDGSAYVRGQREALAPIFLPTRDAAASHLLGDLGACFGPEIRLSYWGRSFAGTADPIAHNVFIAPVNAGSTYWSRTVADGADFLEGWRKVEFHLDTQWSDAEAEAHGWVRLRGSDSWADTLANVGRHEFFKGAGNTGDTRIAGIDEIRVSPSPIPLDGLIAYYPFDGDAGDASDFGNDGTVTGAALAEDAACAPDRAFSFDGAGDFIDIPGFSGAPAEGTIAAWARVERFDTGFNQLNLVFGQTDVLQLGLGDSSIGADGRWVFRHRDGSGFHNVIGPEPALGRWTHVAGVWNGTEAVLFLDGAEVARVASGTLATVAGSARIGAHPFASQNYWDGRIDEVLLYGRALDTSEIASLAAAFPYPVAAPEPVSLVLDGDTLTIEWRPATRRTFIEVSTDLDGWSDHAGPIDGCRWSGPLPEDTEGRLFLRIRAEFPQE